MKQTQTLTLNKNFLTFLLVCLFILMFVTKRNAFKDGKFVCDNYLANIYLYTSIWVLTSFIITYVAMSLHIDLSSKLYVLLFAQVILFAIIMYVPIDESYMITKHLLALLYVGITSLLLASFLPSINISNRILLVIFGIVLILFVIASIFGHIYKDLITKQFIFMFVIIFFLFIIVDIILAFFFPTFFINNPFIDFILAIIFIIFIFVLITIKTKLYLNKEKTCLTDKNEPNYIRHGLSFYIDIQTWFMEFVRAYAAKKKLSK